MESPAAQALTQQLSEDPYNWDLRCRLAEQLAMEGRGAEAVTVLDSAEEEPVYEAQILKAAEIYSMVDPQQAVPLLHGFLTDCPDSAVGHLAMAETAAKLGDIPGATQYYEVALGLNKAYRDPDFENKYGITVENAPRPMTAKTATVPLEATQSASGGKPAETKAIEDTDAPPMPKGVQPSRSRNNQTQSGDESGDDGESSPSRQTGRTRKSIGGFGCLVMSLTAVGVFLLGWLVTIFVVKAMLS
tara:strand:- start:918 stop:1652 length:735 start_codon:yes stop_codon:yes gene_type:complete